ncbi:MAG: octanoyltransferase, partial [Candidatus Omnitrophica bacterium]|nr:octanoyltransferase [Candidatus Omnitrophota bacterium]
MRQQWRLILDNKEDGFLNMAIDEAIFDNYMKYKIPTLRIYGWKDPFITLGYGQNPDNVLIKGQSI